MVAFTLLQTCHALIGSLTLPHITCRIASIAPCKRANAANLALSPTEQFKLQQEEMRTRRQRRVEAELEAAKPDEAVLQKRAALQADVHEFERAYSRPLSIFNNQLFPPAEYEQRNGQSRKDGYWSFVGKGEEAPLEFTYGEFPLQLFSKLVDRACELLPLTANAQQECNDRSGVSIGDLGSGTGRLALWAAATSVWKRVVGIEYLPSIAADGIAKLSIARGMPTLLQTEDVQLIEGSWDDPDALDWADLDVAFAYTTAITANEDGVLEGLSSALARRLRRGCIVVTTDYRLDPEGFEVLDKIEGQNDGVGGLSTGFIHRKICAGERDMDGERIQPESSLTAATPSTADVDSTAASGGAAAGSFEEMQDALLSDLLSAFSEE
jgi:SAM-dependent methyltransferase